MDKAVANSKLPASSSTLPVEPETDWSRREKRRLEIDGTQKLKDKLPWDAPKHWVYEPVRVDHDMAFGERSEKQRRAWVRKLAYAEKKKRNNATKDFSAPRAARKQKKRGPGSGVPNNEIIQIAPDRSKAGKRKRDIESGEQTNRLNHLLAQSG